MMQVRAHIVNEADASPSCGSNPGRVLHTIVSYCGNGERWARLKCIWGRTFLGDELNNKQPSSAPRSRNIQKIRM
eukprot:scaffold62632_cov62-Attheya_sp.AAC.1